MKIKLLPALLFLSCLCVTSASPALAQVNFTDDQAAFLAQNPNLQFQDFSGAPDPLPQVCTNPATSSSNDGCFVPGRILEGIEFFVDPPSFNDMVLEPGDAFGDNNPPFVLVANVGGLGASLDIVFTDGGINAVGFNAGCLLEGGPCDKIVRVSVFGDSGLLGTTELPVTTAFNSFLGINTVEPITEIVVLDPNDDAIQGVINVWFGTRVLETNIPTLSEWGMIAAFLGLGLVGVLFAMRKKTGRV